MSEWISPWGEGAITFDGWWGDETEDDKIEIGGPWERFTILVHGEEAGDLRPITREELLAAAEAVKGDTE